MEIRKNNCTVTLKKEFLSNGEIYEILRKVLKIYKDTNDFEGYSFSPFTMETNFFALLFDVCIKDYDIKNIDEFDKLFNAGIHEELLDKVTNAKYAYDKMNEIARGMSGIEGILDKNLTALLEIIKTRIPDEKTLTKMLNRLPKEWKRVTEGYSKITGVDVNKEDK